ncbi:hypothetical protein K469DRAFT_373794 [Zopfia rhizophila CBS 207.26]|uniref:Uncharacterized protein n=1 Tax=Zopfia rhizophila CBS 207.26 TaxID=1314779 RepID=A0A6A6EK83_9PEZI|nr:hypothetical protein K469DRAFT_373794 [Zopfia rhizophila CBS 207.26]
MQYDYARVCLYEIGLEESHFSVAFERIDVFRNCLDSIKSLYATNRPMVTILPQLINLPSHTFSQSNHSIFVAMRLISVRCEGWSGQIVEQELGLKEIFDNTVGDIDQTLKQASEHDPPIQIPSFFTRLPLMCKELKK